MHNRTPGRSDTVARGGCWVAILSGTDPGVLPGWRGAFALSTVVLPAHIPPGMKNSFVLRLRTQCVHIGLPNAIGRLDITFGNGITLPTAESLQLVDGSPTFGKEGGRRPAKTVGGVLLAFRETKKRSNSLSSLRNVISTTILYVARSLDIPILQEAFRTILFGYQANIIREHVVYIHTKDYTRKEEGLETNTRISRLGGLELDRPFFESKSCTSDHRMFLSSSDLRAPK